MALFGSTRDITTFKYITREVVEGFGSSYSIIIKGHYASPDALGIKQQRL
jgi:hypothetical protein